MKPTCKRNVHISAITPSRMTSNIIEYDMINGLRYPHSPTIVWPDARVGAGAVLSGIGFLRNPSGSPLARVGAGGGGGGGGGSWLHPRRGATPPHQRTPSPRQRD